jgi:hypothetical protein
VTLRLSKDGGSLVASLIERARRATEATLAPLTPSEQRRFVALLRKIA